MHGQVLNILLVEDNLDHAELIRRSLQDHRVSHRVYHVSNGEAALDYLFRRGVYTDGKTSPRPHVVLLDLRLPRIDGLEVLREIKLSEELNRIPVVILTTSAANRDVASAYDNGANSYLVKPVDFENFVQMMEDLGFYWLCWNCYPWKGSKNG